MKISMGASYRLTEVTAMIKIVNEDGSTVQISELNMARLLEAAEGSVANVTDPIQEGSLRNTLEVLSHDLRGLPEPDLCWGSRWDRQAGTMVPCR